MYNLENIPKLPGCYIFKNKPEQIIYIGKSKCLYNRVRQYFTANSANSGGYNKYAELAKEVCEIETIVTDTETDALILECRLIKTHKPKYNSQLKQSIPYPYIRVGFEANYPVISVAESVAEDGAKYFGSFYDKYDALKTIEMISGIWQTPDCGRVSAKPCLNYHIGKCCAPCGGMINTEEYLAKITETVKCLSGDFKQTRRRLKKEMSASAEALEFEKATKIRDGLAGLDRLEARQKRLYTDLKNKPVYLFLRAFNEPGFSLFFINDGVTLNRAVFFQSFTEEALARFISENKEKAPTEDGAFLTQCLLAIGASKLFVPAAKNASESQILRKLKKAYSIFSF